MNCLCGLVRCPSISSSFFVAEKEYTSCGVSFWGLFKAHVVAAQDKSKPLCSRILQLSMAVLEFLPVISQIVSAIECLIFKLLKNCFPSAEKKTLIQKNQIPVVIAPKQGVGKQEPSKEPAQSDLNKIAADLNPASLKDEIKENEFERFIQANQDSIMDALEANTPFPPIPSQIPDCKDKHVESTTEIYTYPKFKELISFAKEVKNEFKDCDIGLLMRCYEGGNYCSIFAIRDNLNSNIKLEIENKKEKFEQICNKIGFESLEIMNRNANCVFVIFKYRSKIKI